MSSPHPPTGPTSSSPQAEPAWNPGGASLSYINKTGGRKFGFMGFLLRTSPAPIAPAADALNSDGSAFEGFPCFVCWVLIVVAMPVTSFALGTWQVYRLQWKKGLIEKYSNNLAKPPIILPKDVGYSIVKVCKLIV